jgi:hypothetical protein
MSRDTAPSPDTAVPEVPTMTPEHLRLATEIWDIAKEQSYTDEVEQYGPRVEEIIALVRSLSSGRGVYVPREEIDALLEDALSYHTNTTRSWRTSCINRIAKTLTRWLSGSPTPPPAEDRT